MKTLYTRVSPATPTYLLKWKSLAAVSPPTQPLLLLLKIRLQFSDIQSPEQGDKRYHFQKAVVIEKLQPAPPRLQRPSWIHSEVSCYAQQSTTQKLDETQRSTVSPHLLRRQGYPERQYFYHSLNKKQVKSHLSIHSTAQEDRSCNVEWKHPWTTAPGSLLCTAGLRLREATAEKQDSTSTQTTHRIQMPKHPGVHKQGYGKHRLI